MKLNKVIKKIAAFGAGATLIGATLSGALAADLSEYPAMFIKNGNFDGILVVGEKAQPIDIIGVTNLGMSLQSAAVTKTKVCSTGTTSKTKGESAKFQTAGTKLDIFTTLNRARTQATDADLPIFLADGTYTENEGANKNSVDYSQIISFPDPGTPNFISTEDDDYAPYAGPYILFPSLKPAYKYTLEFSSPVLYENSTAGGADLDGTALKIQGTTFTITDVKLNAGNEIERMALLVGNDIKWMKQGDVIEKSINDITHTIKMIDVSVGGTSCGLDVDGTTHWIDVGSAEEIGDLNLGVSDAKAVHTEKYDTDICKVSFGASEYLLEQGNEIKKDGVEIEGSYAAFNLTSARVAGQWSGLTIKWSPDRDTYISPEAVSEVTPRELVDPVFGRFQFVFDDDVRTDDTIYHTTSAKKGEIKFLNYNEGKEIVLPVYASDDNSTVPGVDSVGLGSGSDADEKYYYYSSGGQTKTTCAPSTADVRLCKGARWITERNNQAHLLELTDIDLTDAKISFKDITSGTSSSNLALTNASDHSVTNTVYISGFQSIGVQLNSSHVTLSSIGNADNIKSSKGALLNIREANHSNGLVNDLSVTWVEEATTYYHPGFAYFMMYGLLTSTSPDIKSNITATFTYDATSDEQIELNEPVVRTNLYQYIAVFGPTAGTDITGVNGTIYALSVAFGSNVGGQSKPYSFENEDIQVRSTWRGTGIGHDVENDNLLVVMYPDEKVTADLYIAPTEVDFEISKTTGQTCQDVEKINKIPSTVNKLDIEVADIKAQNVISVGGPCANKVSAALMGNPSVCYEGFENGKAFITLTESGTKVAMVVAGSSGTDTLVALNMLSDYGNYAGKLKGKELTLMTGDPKNIKFEEGLKKAASAAQTAGVTVTAPGVTVTAPGVTVTVPAEPAKKEFSCVGTSSEKGTFDVSTSKLGIKQASTATLEVKTDGLNGELTFIRSEEFKPKMGVDWYQFVAHILDSKGAEVKVLTYKWVDGEKDKTQSFTVPEEGCYTLKLVSADLTVDDAKIEMTSNSGVFTKEFRTG